MTRYTLEQLLDAACPHDKPLRDCDELWCRSRVEDLLAHLGSYELPDPDADADDS